MKYILKEMRELCLRACSRRFGYVSILLAIFLIQMYSSGAQQPPNWVIWRGILRNPAAAPVAGAHMRLAGNSESAEAVTAADGHFRFTALPAGQYKLTVISGGQTTLYSQAIDLKDGAPTALATLSSHGELTIAVLNEQPAATGGEALSSQAVSELPLNKRDFSQLLLLAAGTMTDANGATNFTAQFAINGQRGVEATGKPLCKVVDSVDKCRKL